MASCWLTIWELKCWLAERWVRRPIGGGGGGGGPRLTTSPWDRRRAEPGSAGLAAIGCWGTTMSAADWSEKLSMSVVGGEEGNQTKQGSVMKQTLP